MNQAQTDKNKANSDGTRELCETIVVVLVLVTLLRGFVAEAFVIPTGSMAPTLYGANKVIVCPECGHATHVGTSSSQKGESIVRSFCQNCLFPISAAADPAWKIPGTNISAPTLGWLTGEWGDRVVVAKYMYEGLREPQRWDVPVFKFPARSADADLDRAQGTRPSRTNFIKRLAALPLEDVMILYGDVFVRKPPQVDYAIASKPPRVMMSTRRLVYNNDRPAKDLLDAGFPARWYSQEGDQWTPQDGGRGFHLSGTGWLAYRHLVGGGERDHHGWREVSVSAGRAPQIITDYEAYNFTNSAPQYNWVGDLMLEFHADVRKLEGELLVELVEGTRRYQCRFDLAGRKVRITQGDVKLAEAESPIKQAGGWNLRFANFDDRLVLWCDERLIFGDGVEVKPLGPGENGPLPADLRPVRIGGAATDVLASHIQLFRDIYYTQQVTMNDCSSVSGPDPTTAYPLDRDDLDALANWRQRLTEVMEKAEAQAKSDDKDSDRPFRVPADSYLMLGDNSPLSSDGRAWDLTHYVHRRMLLGRAIIVYWPLDWPPWNLKLIQ